MRRIPILFVLLAACGEAAAPAVPAATVPATSAAPDEVILEVHRGGGLCVDGPCSTTWTVFADGRVEVSDGGAFTITGADMTALRGELAVGFGELPPFAGTCPEAYDGPRFTYTVGATAVDSCVSDVGGSPLVRLIDEALGFDVVDY